MAKKTTNQQLTCAQLQGIRDLIESGAIASTVSLGEAERILSASTTESRKLNRNLQARWDSHQYPDSSIVYIQVTNDPRLSLLSCDAQAVLLLLGTHVLQSGLIKITVDQICKLTGLKRTKAKEAIAELKDCGVLAIYRKAARHEAPIYSIDPKIINVGKRVKAQHTQHMHYVDKGTDYLLNREPAWDVIRKATTMTVEDTEYNEDGHPVTVTRKVRYMDIDVQPHKKAPESDGDSKGSSADISGKSRTHTNTRKDVLASYECDGQCELADILAEMDAAPDLEDTGEELPFEV